MATRIGCLAAALFACLHVQEGPERDIAGLIEELKSDRAQDRDRATQKLKALGKAAVPSLEQASKSPDPELAERARVIRGMIELVENLPPRIERRFSDHDEQLALGKDHEWTTVFLEAAEPAADFYPSDLVPLLPRAFRGAESADEKGALVEAVAKRGLLQALPQLTELLRDPEPEMRLEVITALRQLKAQSAVPLLRGTLADADPYCRAKAAAGLADLGCREALPDLLRLLEGFPENAPHLEEVIEAVGRLGGSEVVPLLAGFLKHPNPSARMEAATALGRRAAADRSDEVLALVQDPVDFVRQAAADALGALRARGAIPRLRGLLGSASPEAKSGALRALSALHAKEASVDVIALLKDPSPRIRRAAVEAAAALGSPEADRALGAALEDEAPEVRAAAAEALGRKRAADGGPSLVRALKDPGPGVRLKALLALEELGARSSAPEVLALLQDPDSEVRRAAIEALEAWRFREGGLEIGKALGDPDRTVRWAALDAIRHLRLTPAMPAVLGLLGEEDGFLSANAIDAFDRAGGDELVPRLEELLRGKASVTEKRGAMYGLAVLGSASSTEKMAPFLKDESGDLRAMSARALGILGARRYAPDILALLTSEAAEVPVACIEALGVLRAPSATPALLKHLRNPRSPFRGESAVALAQIGVREALGDIVKVLDPVREDPGDRQMAIDAVRILGGPEAVPLLLKALTDEDETVKATAAEALSNLGIGEAVPGIRELLQAQDSVLREAAAKSLAKLGLRDGGEALVSDRDDVGALNALRRPRVYERLARTRIGKDLEGTIGTVLDLLAERAGLKVQGPPDASFYATWRARHLWIPDEGEHVTVFRALERLFSGPYGFVLEEDAVRVVPVEDVLDFWAKWWAETEPPPRK